MAEKFSIGIDFGTESARAVIVNVATGAVAASATHAYRNGVLDARLPGTETALPSEYALQHPDDWLESMTEVIRDVLKKSRVHADAVIGVGIDFTSCTILPTTSQGTPLCTIEKFQSHPHAWPKLWKHHAAQSQANRINALAAERREHWLARYGGKISAEWVMPKALQILEEDFDAYTAAKIILEGGDWIVWQLTGNLVRNACAAGYKGTWHKHDGWVNENFLSAINPGFKNLFSEKFSGTIAAPGICAGGLSENWAQRLGLRAGTAVGVAIIDAHAACLGGGVGDAATMYMIMGTSTCHMLMAHTEEIVEGISGVVEDGIAAGLFGYEAGQSSAGDAIGWFTSNAIPFEYYAEAERRNISTHEILSERAARVQPGASGLIALDWWNGCRTPLVDANLSGMILGLHLATRAEEIYRAIIEATAFGTRLIIETFTTQHVPVNGLVAGGGLTKNNLLMQIYSDVCGREISVAGGSDASALGAAILGAVAAGKNISGVENIPEACAIMAAKSSKTFFPDKKNHATYNQLYKIYLELHRYFGIDNRKMMLDLKSIASR